MINIIVAYCRNRGIGFQNRLPWNLSADLRYFKKLTIGDGRNAVVMGRNTWEGLPEVAQPLPKRANIILSRGRKPKKTGSAGVWSDIPSMKNFCRKRDYSQVWIIGGEEIYKQFMDDPDLKNIYVTYIDEAFQCDTFFPSFKDNFDLKWQSGQRVNEGLPYCFRHYIPREK